MSRYAIRETINQRLDRSISIIDNNIKQVSRINVEMKSMRTDFMVSLARAIAEINESIWDSEYELCKNKT